MTMTPEEKKEAQARANRKYYIEHTEKAKEYSKKYKLAHPEETKEKNKKYSLEHLEKIKEKNKKYKLEHPEEIKECNKKYYIEHTEKAKEGQKKYNLTSKGKEAQARAKIRYYQTHPEAYLNLTARRYVTQVIKPEILLRDNFTCQLCGTIEGKLVVHHIIPVKYDKDEQNIKNPENLITLCPTCHKTAHKNNWSEVDTNLGKIFLKYTKSKKI